MALLNKLRKSVIPVIVVLCLLFRLMILELRQNMTIDTSFNKIDSRTYYGMFQVAYNLNEALHGATIGNVSNETLNQNIISQATNKNDFIQTKEIVDKNFKILYWTKSFRDKSWFGVGQSPFEMCQFKNCNLTFDKNEYNSSDAILISLHYSHREPLPKYRPSSKQKWIMRFNESPVHAPIYHIQNWTMYENIFNATWTYHSKSDVWTNYTKGYFRKTVKDIEHKVNHAAGKNITAAWFASFCVSKSLRENFVKNFQKYLPVNVYGYCGTMKCKEPYNSPCVSVIKKLKFYLAFENSLCQEYVTEKTWKAINHGALPVVMGAHDYSKMLPPHSYIDIKDFKSLKELAEYLKKVDSDDVLYNEYFAWKGKYEYVKFPPHQCTLCEYMNREFLTQKVYPSIKQFWNEDTDCYKPWEYYTSMEREAWT